MILREVLGAPDFTRLWKSLIERNAVILSAVFLNWFPCFHFALFLTRE